MQNPIQAALHQWITKIISKNSPDQQLLREKFLSTAPKRYTIYEPLVLLPSGSFSSAAWQNTLRNCDDDTLSSLWALLVKELSRAAKGPLTHLAITEGIPSTKEGAAEENILRSPIGLRMLYGDFGPSTIIGQDPTLEDFESALWVSTKQNGISQTWAPRWTMFSRGNIKEKARLLAYEDSSQAGPNTGHTDSSWAVDLYAGIGYFVFSYAALGFKVLCWEINPWSVEGLRRGAKANKWTVKVVQGPELALPTEQILESGEQIMVFLEDNQRALQRITEIPQIGEESNIRHVNCGFLPTSEPTWRDAWLMTAGSTEVWLHLHENVGVEDIECRRKEIKDMFASWCIEGGADCRRVAAVEHVERVKTFAPGVWHCVFDVYITQTLKI